MITGRQDRAGPGLLPAPDRIVSKKPDKLNTVHINVDHGAIAAFDICEDELYAIEADLRSAARDTTVMIGIVQGPCPAVGRPAAAVDPGGIHIIISARADNRRYIVNPDSVEICIGSERMDNTNRVQA